MAHRPISLYLETDCRRLNRHHHWTIAIAANASVVVEFGTDCCLGAPIVANATGGNDATPRRTNKCCLLHLEGGSYDREFQPSCNCIGHHTGKFRLARERVSQRLQVFGTQESVGAFNFIGESLK